MDKKILYNSKIGWIGLYRSVRENWIYPKDKFTKFEAWIDLLLMVNHTEKELFDGSDIVNCEVGQTMTSQQKLMKKWGWSKSKLLNYLKLLQKDGKIDYKTTTKKTIITIVKYTQYQDFREIDKIKKDHKKTIEELQKKLQKALQKDFKPTTNNNEEEYNNEDNLNNEEVKIPETSSGSEKKPKKKKKVDPLFKPFRELFEKHYTKVSEIEYYWNPKDAVATNKIIKQVRHAYSSVGNLNPSDEEMKAGYEGILQRALKDKWLSQNFEPSIISSKFNNLKSKGNDTTKQAIKSVAEGLRKELVGDN